MSKSNETTTNVPTLRFREFTDSWTLIPIKKMLRFQNGINADSTKYGKGIKYISVSDILNNQYITYDCIKGLIDIDEKTFNKFIVEYGDILFQRSSETFEDIGRANVYLDKEHSATFGGFVIRGKKISDYNPLFFRYLLCTHNARKQTVRMGAGAQHYNIGQEGLEKICLYFPCLQEQQKISDLLSAIDNKIAVQNKIISKYETLIKGLSYYIIKKFNGKAYKLGTLAKIYQPQTITKTDLPDNGKYPVYGANGIIGFYDRFNHKESQIMITCRGSTCGTVNLSIPYSWITGNSMVINIDEHKSIVDKKYLYYYLKTQSFNDLISGSGQPQIVRKPLVNLNVFLPEISQQIKLSAIIDIFEKALKNEKEMLSALQKQKAFLLQSMFI